MDRLMVKSNTTNLYFKGEAEKFIFALLVMDGHCRSSFLDIGLDLYDDVEAAKAWRDDIYNIISQSSHPMTSKAIARLDRFYENMVNL